MSRHLARWFVGAIMATLMIAVTSPIFIRSYLPLTVDPQRGSWTLMPQQTYRWRSEGYATTKIGPLGMPGKSEIFPPSRSVMRVALWGDSQAEGVSLPDDHKLFAELERYGDGKWEVFPLCRSGEDAAVWCSQMRRVEQNVGIEMHIVLIVELDDLACVADATAFAPTQEQIEAGKNSVANWLPAFVIQAARNLLTQSDGVTPRKLRFGLGPIESTRQADVTTTKADDVTELIDWGVVLAKIRKSSERPFAIVYAPKLPLIVGGKVLRVDPNAHEIDRLKEAADDRKVLFIDCSADLLAAAQQGEWPHGFHNGRIGSGHLNRVGNSIIAKRVTSVILTSTHSSIVQPQASFVGHAVHHSGNESDSGMQSMFHEKTTADALPDTFAIPRAQRDRRNQEIFSQSTAHPSSSIRE